MRRLYPFLSMGNLLYAIVLLHLFFLPFMGTFLIRTVEMGLAQQIMLLLSQLIPPLLFIPYVLHGISFYVASPLTQLLAAGKSKYRIENTLLFILIYAILSGLSLMALVYLNLISDGILMRTSSILIMFLGVSYLMVSIQKNTTVAFVVCMTYVIFSLAFGDQRRPYPFYITTLDTPLPMYVSAYLIYIMIGIVGLIIGELYIRKKGLV